MAKHTQIEHAREIFRAWMRHWDYFSEGAPDDREVDAFLRAIIDGVDDLVEGGQEARALQVFEESRAKVN